MGVCTSKANRRVQEHNQGKAHINTVCRSDTSRHESTKPSLYSNHEDHMNNIILDQIRNAPDDPNIIILSDLTNSETDIPDFSYGNGKRSISDTFSLLNSPIRQHNIGSMADETTETVCTEESIYDIPNWKQSMKMTIGDEIELNDTYNALHGIIRFIGELPKYQNIFYGIQLSKPQNSDDITYWKELSDRNNGFAADAQAGYMDNIHYFDTHGNDAIFVTQQQINRVLNVNYDVPRISINDEIFVDKYNCNGMVKYIGKPKFTNDENIREIYYGIQLNAYNSEAMNGMFHNRCYFSDCASGYGIFLNASELSYFVRASKYNLLLHGFINQSANIPSGVIKLVQSYSHSIEIKCVMNERERLNDNIYKRYESFDIDHNICGPAISVIKDGRNTHSGHFEVKVCGYYQFTKDTYIDTGDFMQQFVKKTEYQIFKLENGGIEMIFRSMKSDNENPLFKDYKSVQMRFRHDIYRNNVNDCDHRQIFEDIANLYGLLPKEMEKQFKRYGIELYGLDVCNE